MWLIRTYSDKDKKQPNPPAHPGNAATYEIPKVVDWNDISDNPDKEYMEKCHEVDTNRPNTWKPYANAPMAIINMEYNELKNAKTDEELEENLYHLSVACLNMWRHKFRD